MVLWYWIEGCSLRMMLFEFRLGMLDVGIINGLCSVDVLLVVE